MNLENTQRIISTCPSLFATDSSNPIFFGFECGDGWANLLVELCAKINLRLQQFPKNIAEEFVVLQVKEKYGKLRFYMSYADDIIDSYIKDAEQQSSVTCETCGKSGKLRGTMWLYVACDSHTLDVDLNPPDENDLP